MSRRLQLVATAAPGHSSQPEIVNPDGTQSAFAIRGESALIVTDISIHRTGVVSGSGLFAVSLVQKPPTMTQLRWAFVGDLSANFERSFTTGIVFSTLFEVENASSSADVVAVRVWGYLDLL
jgi:hypothetical protein